MQSGARTTAPRPVVSNEVLVEALSSQIYASMRTFHEHSKTCKPCRNPIYTYQERRDLCPAGRVQCTSIMELLYRKAALVPKGTFTVEYKQGWDAVDGLIRIICHHKQGEYTNKVIDLARAVPKDSVSPKRRSAEIPRKSVEYVHGHGHSSNSSGFASDSDEDVPRGSAYHEDMARRSGQHYTTSSHKSRSHSRPPRREGHREGHHRHRPDPATAYADPRTSYLDAPSALAQAEYPPSSPTTSSSKSVHFANAPEVREFEAERRLR